MNILVCGGRNYGHVVRTVGDPNLETEEMKKRIAEYQHVQDVLHGMILTYSNERKDGENWLPTDITIIEGGATGADSAAADFAICNYCQIKEYKADWKKHGKAAGPIRNKQMIQDGKPDLVVAFPGGEGTKNMIEQAQAANIAVMIASSRRPTPDQQ